MDEVTTSSITETRQKEIVLPLAHQKSRIYLQSKYDEILEVVPEKITNTKLYEFIDEWMGIPYVMRGNNKQGIDCSSVTLSFFGQVYIQFNIGKTAKQQADLNS